MIDDRESPDEYYMRRMREVRELEEEAGDATSVLLALAFLVMMAFVLGFIYYGGK